MLVKKNNYFVIKSKNNVYQTLKLKNGIVKFYPFKS